MGESSGPASRCRRVTTRQGVGGSCARRKGRVGVRHPPQEHEWTRGDTGTTDRVADRVPSSSQCRELVRLLVPLGVVAFPSLVPSLVGRGLSRRYGTVGTVWEGTPTATGRRVVVVGRRDSPCGLPRGCQDTEERTVSFDSPYFFRPYFSFAR